MSKPIRASMLMVAMILLAAPLLAKAAPGLVGSENSGQAVSVYAKNDDVDCSKLDNDDARRKCREAKQDNKKNDKSDVDCSKLDNDDARKKCREAKIKH